MTTDLRCPIFGSKRIRNYSMAMAKYRSPDFKIFPNFLNFKVNFKVIFV
ncbi:hypothetical protein MSIBF_A1830020 [groundwater metagenome]|uniref:Uncharacterized protein n=1 Tax=groundwater metagenome TaxID=717931 RepID=A0A098E8Z9_9ZZZZ